MSDIGKKQKHKIGMGYEKLKQTDQEGNNSC
jgi:hypothetical protein